jgi:hypothetical protein
MDLHRMDAETRAQLLADRLRPVLAVELSPDAAGSKAPALALLAVRAETPDGGAPIPDRENALARDIHQLPRFIVWEQDRGSTDDMMALVRRFVAGERSQADPDLRVNAAGGAAQRRARLRELQSWGVDLSLIEMTLRQSPTERIMNMERQLQLVRQLQQAVHPSGSA